MINTAKRLRKIIREAFADHAYRPATGPLQYVIEDYPLRLIGLDSLVEEQAGGTLDEARLRWLSDTLGQAPGKTTLLFVHHPPFRTGIEAMDAIGFHESEKLGAIVARNPQTERVVCGQIHRAMQLRCYGTIASTAPSTAYQFVLELRARERLGITREPPGFALHIWSDGRLA